jgi:hypothetical protein
MQVGLSLENRECPEQLEARPHLNRPARLEPRLRGDDITSSGGNPTVIPAKAGIQ